MSSKPLTIEDATGVCDDGDGPVVHLLDELAAGLGTLAQLANHSDWSGQQPQTLLFALERKAKAALTLADHAQDDTPSSTASRECLAEANENLDRLVGAAVLAATARTPGDIGHILEVATRLRTNIDGALLQLAAKEIA